MKKIISKIIAILTIIYFLGLIIVPVSEMAVEYKDIITFGNARNLSVISTTVQNTNSKLKNKFVLDKSEYSAEYKEYLKLSDEEKSKLGVIPNMYDILIDASIFEKNNNFVGAGNLPSSYTLTSADVDNDGTIDINVETYRNLPMKIKDQEQENLCWAFASLNSLETNLYLNGYKDENGQLWDYSEEHVNYCGIFGTDCNGQKIVDDRDVYDGGNFVHFLIYNMDNYPFFSGRGYGTVLEEEAPYGEDYYSQEGYNYLTSLYRRATTCDFEFFAKIDKENGIIKTSNGNYEANEQNIKIVRDAIKQHIVNDGSLYASIDSRKLAWSSDNSQIVLNSTSTVPDHAISIIGWDDNYSKENFPEECRPNSNGAYIAMNSWGDAYGINNIFYISYEDYLVEKEMSGVTDSIIFNPLYLEVTAEPSQTKYFAGETFNTNGLKIEAHYQYDEVNNHQNGEVKDITSLCQIDTTTPLTLDDEFITIQYEDNSTSTINTLRIPITVNEFKLGDINRDTKLTLYDAFTMLRKVITDATLTDMDKKIMDYNNDGKITLYDTFSFLRQIILS